jgi:type IX secretion system PorP/SprF family membrane protein
MRKVCIIILFLNILSAKAQQTPVYSQYMIDKFLINPALAGFDGYSTISLVTRKQWIGLQDAPSTYCINGQIRVLKNSNVVNSSYPNKQPNSGKVGLGINVFSDKNGIFSRTGVQFTYAYHIDIKKSHLSFGLTGIAYQFKANTSDLDLTQVNDETINGLKNFIVPDANLGVYYYNTLYYMGISANQLFESALKIGEPSSSGKYNTLSYYNLIAGYKYKVSGFYILEPSVFLKTTKMLNFQTDFNLRLYFDDEYWAGISYRTNNAIIIMAGFKTGRYYLGYSFDYNLTDIQRYSYGSHEIVISVKLGDDTRRYRWINRY